MLPARTACRCTFTSSSRTFCRDRSRLPGCPASYPPSLTAYYAELLAGYRSSLQALLTPLIVTLAWAKTPLDDETLHLLMVRRKVLDGSDAARTLLRQALETLQGMIRLAPVPGLDHPGYELYHPTFREHIHNDPQGTLAMQNQIARQEFCGLVREWKTIPELRHAEGSSKSHPALASHCARRQPCVGGWRPGGRV